jgi:hypothetical protein
MGAKVAHALHVFGDYLRVIQNVNIKDSLLMKKPIAISYHKTREAKSAGIKPLIKILGTWIHMDCLTKSMAEKIFGGLTNCCMMSR